MESDEILTDLITNLEMTAKKSMCTFSPPLVKIGIKDYVRIFFIGKNKT